MYNVRPNGNNFEVYHEYTDGMQAIFPDESSAEAHASQLISRSKIDCCETSLHSRGWHHCGGCDRVSSYTNPDAKYRMYYIKTAYGIQETHFENLDLNRWACTHGGWKGIVQGGDELTLHHAYGSVTYDWYKESDRPICFTEDQ